MSGFVEDSRLRFGAEVRKHFRPEFFNRLDAVATFSPLAPADVRRSVDLERAQATARAGLAKRNLRLRVTPAARDRLARLGYDPDRGARPLKRVIEERVMTPVAVRLAAEPEIVDIEIVVGAPDLQDAPDVEAAGRWGLCV